MRKQKWLPYYAACLLLGLLLSVVSIAFAASPAVVDITSGLGSDRRESESSGGGVQ